MATFLLIIIGAGLGGTLLGGFVGLTMHERSSSMLGILLSVSSGILLSIIGFDLIPEALEHGSVVIVGSFVLAGIVLIALISRLLGHHHHDDDHTHTHEEEHCHDELEDCEACEEKLIPYNEGHFHVHDGNLRKTGLVMLLAVALHNIPSGLAIGTGYAHNQGVGIMLALLIALHNLPEGMAITLPLIGSEMKKGKVLFLISLTGVPTIAGGITGYSLSHVSEALIAVLLSVAAGAMLYVTVMEIVPQARALYHKRSFVLLMLLGVMIGFLLINLTHGGAVHTH